MIEDRYLHIAQSTWMTPPSCIIKQAVSQVKVWTWARLQLSCSHIGLAKQLYLLRRDNLFSFFFSLVTDPQKEKQMIPPAQHHNLDLLQMIHVQAQLCYCKSLIILAKTNNLIPTELLLKFIGYSCIRCMLLKLMRPLASHFDHIFRGKRYEQRCSSAVSVDIQ